MMRLGPVGLLALMCACGSGENDRNSGSMGSGSAGVLGGTGGDTSLGAASGEGGHVPTGGAVGPESTGGTVATGGDVGGGGGLGAIGGSGATGGLVVVGGSDAAGGLVANGGAAGGVGGLEMGAVPHIGDLAVEPNPNNALSCIVNWTTDVAASSEVQFGIGELAFRIVDDEPKTTHSVLVIGMYASSDYLIRVVSTSSSGVDSEDTSFATGPLPDGVPEGVLSTNDSASQSGWTLTNIMPAGTYFPGTEPGLVVMYDQAGVPVWYFVHGTNADANGDVSVKTLPNGNLMIGPSAGEPPKEIDLAGNVVWAGPPQPETNRGNDLMSHQALKLHNGNYVLLREHTQDGFIGALVEEVTPDNQVVWSWNLFDHLQPDPEAAEDWCHPNAVTIDLAEDVLYLSCRYLGVIKAHRSGEQSIIWILGEHTDDGDFSFQPPGSGFADQHDPEIHDDGSILVFDNGGFDLRPDSPNRSRIAEYALDEQTWVAQLLWEFPGDFAVDAWFTDWYSAYWGDADRLANGNVLVSAGTHALDGQSHIFEFDPRSGRVVWELVLPVNVGSYQAERLSPPPLVEAM